MTEPREALAEEIVDAILDRPSADPDDDLAKLARRYLRADPYLRSEGPGLDALREALIRYGARHLSDCRASNPADPCTCGLNALLTEGGSR